MKYYSYDIFLSHNRADKEFVRLLAIQLSGINYNGRLLRPWLDEQFLDTGELGNDSELTSALDQSRIMCLVLSPEAMSSHWVSFELDHFLQSRTVGSIVLLLRKSCTVPIVLQDQPVIDYSDDYKNDAALELLIAKICPAGEVDINEVKGKVVASFESMWENDEGGFSPGPTRERDAFFNALMKYNINDAAAEGLALAAFKIAAEGMYRIDNDDDKLFNCKMLLGDCLGAAAVRNDTYRQVMQLYLQIAEAHPETSLLLFVLGRAYAKLADLNIKNIDVSIILRIASQLDSKTNIGNEDKALQVLLARTIAKIRDTQIGELLIKTLSVAGSSSRIISIGAISITYYDSDPVFYISELEMTYKQQLQQGIAIPPPIPSTKLLGLLYDMEMDENPMVQNSLKLARNDLEKAYPILNFPYYSTYYYGKKDIIETNYRYNVPFLGIVMLATLDNMVGLAAKANTTSIVCLTEPRIVDALFSSASALLILEQDTESLQCRRLRSRQMPFAMLTKEKMENLTDGDFILVNQDSVIFGRGDILKKMNQGGDY